MNCCRETTKIGVPRAAQALAPRAGQPQGVGSEAYLNGTSQGELVLPVPGIVPGSVAEGTPEDARKDSHIRGRSRPFMKHPR